jgi:hypothetical protein
MVVNNPLIVVTTPALQFLEHLALHKFYIMKTIISILLVLPSLFNNSASETNFTSKEQIMETPMQKNIGSYAIVNGIKMY